MTPLTQAEALFNQPLTLEAIQTLDKLISQAHGEEADQLGDLWEAMMVAASPELFAQAQQAGYF